MYCVKKTPYIFLVYPNEGKKCNKKRNLLPKSVRNWTALNRFRLRLSGGFRVDTVASLWLSYHAVHLLAISATVTFVRRITFA